MPSRLEWKQPPIIKIYEALGAVADGRVKIEGEGAKVYSSSGNKFYTVTYDKAAQAIMVNDNGSYYQGYLGYPAIAYLMLAGEIPYASQAAELLKGVAWKDINQKFKNNFEKTLEYILAEMPGEDWQKVETEVARISADLETKNYSLLGAKTKPPEGY